MPLVSSTKLGPYEIMEPLGAGGMGEVYRARDTRLDRTVAIKVLNSTLTASPDVRARFEREARAISQLQHPHICTLYDIGRDNGTDFLVMEYPLIVNVHGGPSWACTSKWQQGGMADMRAASLMGWFVLCPNPRGSYGQGEAFMQGNVKNFGGGDYRDIIAGGYDQGFSDRLEEVGD